MKYRANCNIKHLCFEYADREREAVLSLMSGILHENPYLSGFELISTSAFSFLNVNNYLENFEDFVIGNQLLTLSLRDSMIYTEKTKFLDDGTNNLSSLTINKTVLNQKNFRLSENLRVLKLTPINFGADSFEISLDQFLFVIESLQYNTTLLEFSIGIRHGNIKKKIFNAQLYERERRTCTKKLSNALVKVFAHNKTLKALTV